MKIKLNCFLKSVQCAATDNTDLHVLINLNERKFSTFQNVIKEMFGQLLQVGCLLDEVIFVCSSRNEFIPRYKEAKSGGIQSPGKNECLATQFLCRT